MGWGIIDVVGRIKYENIMTGIILNFSIIDATNSLVFERDIGNFSITDATNSFVLGRDIGNFSIIDTTTSFVLGRDNGMKIS